MNPSFRFVYVKRIMRLKMFVVLVFATMLSGCGGVIVAAALIDASANVSKASENLKPFTQVAEVKIHNDATPSMFQGASILPAVLEANMADQKGIITPNEKNVSDTIIGEILLSLPVSRNVASVNSMHTLQVGTFYASGGGFTVRGQYADIARLNKENRAKWTQERGLGIQKVVDLRLVLKNGDAVLMEARGIWGGNDQADEIAGARQLAREVANAVLKKLNAPASRNTTAEAKKE